MKEGDANNPVPSSGLDRWMPTILFLIPPVGSAISGISGVPTISIILGMCSPLLGLLAGIQWARRLPPDRRSIGISIVCALAGAATCAGLTYAGCAATFRLGGH